VTRTELAQAFMSALLARDPLPAQRFTELDTRLEQLAHIAQRCAATFLSVDAQWEASPETAAVIAEQIWNRSAARTPEVAVPEKLRGSARDPQLPLAAGFGPR
jgi:hypothetical protein